MRHTGLVFIPAFYFFTGTLSHAGIVINEFLPDPQGSDSGREFVELLNTGAEPAPLLGIEFQFANGAEEEHWVLRWVCEDEISLAPGERFLVADRNWQGNEPAGVEVYLGLQNGPDAIRLVQDGFVLDMVGYGLLTDPDLMEGSAVSVVPGLSLARRPDGHDTDNNDMDFVSTNPSPGSANFVPYDLRVVELSMDPPSAQRPEELVSFTIVLGNYGTEVVPTCQVVLQVGVEQIIGVLDSSDPGQERSLLLRGASGDWGRLPVTLSVPVPVPMEFLNISLGHFQVGAGELVINEILGAPDQGQGEWVEFLVTENYCESLDQYSIRDEGGNRVNCLPGPMPVPKLSPGPFLPAGPFVPGNDHQVNHECPKSHDQRHTPQHHKGKVGLRIHDLRVSSY